MHGWEVRATSSYLVYEDFKPDILVDLVRPGDGLVQFDQGLVIVILSVYHKDEGATPTKDVLRVKGRVEEVYLTGEVPDLKGGGACMRNQHKEEGHEHLGEGNQHKGEDA